MIVALDFAGYSFLPPSFFVFALEHGGHSRLKRHLIRMLGYPQSTTAEVLVSASCTLAPFNTNNVGEQISLLSFLFLASCPLTRILSAMYFTGLPRELRSRLPQ
jgi:hypothetical protein